MPGAPSTLPTQQLIRQAVSQLGSDPLTEAALRQTIFPLFSRVLARDADEIVLTNHSLGRPLDCTAQDMAEAANVWFEDRGDAWSQWLAELASFRAETASLCGAARADCIVPKASAGQGLRAVLNSYATPPHILASRGEFDSIDMLLRHYADCGRATVSWLDTPTAEMTLAEALARQCRPGIDLVVVSLVSFADGRLLQGVQNLITAAHAAGARVLLDVYHAYGAVPLHLGELRADYAVAGSYKYLRGGPGACWLYIAPHLLDAGARTLDTGWFAQTHATTGGAPSLAEGGDAWLESTFSPAAFYQARAGLALTQGLGVERLHDYNRRQKADLSARLSACGIAHLGSGDAFGAFLTIPHAQPATLVDALRKRGMRADARRAGVRLCPDILTTSAQLAAAANSLELALDDLVLEQI